jgi:hypothetical protein
MIVARKCRSPGGWVFLGLMRLCWFHAGPAQKAVLNVRHVWNKEATPSRMQWMVVVNIDRGPTAELEVVLELKAVAGRVLNPLNEGDPLPGVVLDFVRVAVGEDASGVRVSGLHSR